MKKIYFVLLLVVLQFGVFGEVEFEGVYHSSTSAGDYDNDGDQDIIFCGYTGTESITKIYRNDGNEIFTDINAGIIGVHYGSVDFGDYDNDGDLDVLVCGYTGSANISKIYQNDSGVFTDINTDLLGVLHGEAKWGDYDNDNDLDILLTGKYYDGGWQYIAEVYRNDSSTFTEINAGLVGVGYSSVEWGDYDNDNDLDILLAGTNGTENYTKVYRNDSDLFVDINADIIGIYDGDVDWGDLHTDGDLDIVICGYSSSGYVTEVYRNNNNIFLEYYTEIIGVRNGSVEWGDYDNDGDLDIFLTGLSNAYTYNSKIYNNNNNSFTDTATEFIDVGYSSATFFDSDSSGILKLFLTGFTGSDCISKIYNGIGLFTDTEIEFSDVELSSFDWGDYDNDGDLDLVLIGRDANSNRISEVFQNDSGTFIDINAGLIGVQSGDVKWGDYDNDGDLDILLTGGLSSIYRNDNGSFTDINAGLMGVRYSTADWIDFDNDGDLDVLISGEIHYDNYITALYRNDSGAFSNIEAGFQGVSYSSSDFGDYDNDGDLDLVITGRSLNDRVSKVYRNDSYTFTDLNAGLIGVYRGEVKWGDYDNDGDLDILLTGYDSSNTEISRIYRNDSGIFTDINAGLIGVGYSSVDWGDYDNDGDLDVLLAGEDESNNRILKIYKNRVSVFLEIATDVSGVRWGSVDWVDYDNDNDLDLMVSGNSIEGEVTRIYSNNTGLKNSVPFSPANLSAIQEENQIVLSWDKAMDNETAQDGLSYNFYIGTEPGLSDIVDPMSDISTGYRKIVSKGIVNNNIWKIHLHETGTYFWSVQTIDHSFAGSEFAAESSFIFELDSTLIPDPPYAISATEIKALSFIANWEQVEGVTEYHFDAAYDSQFLNFVTGYENIYVENQLSLVLEGLDENTDYFYRVRAFKNNNSSDNSNTINEKTLKLAFTEISTVFDEVKYGSNSWGDYDNDGDMDLLITGITETGKISKIYRNDSGIFTNINAGLIGVDNSSVDWGDYDNDGDLDIVITGRDESSNRISKIYNNDNGIFTDVNAGLVGVCLSSVAWGDYDNDGDLDLFLSGTDMNYPQSAFSYIYQNDSGVFTNINAGLEGVCHSSIDWGDYDNDGDLDIVICGFSEFDPLYLFDDDPTETTKIYRNNGDGTFNLSKTLLGVADGSVSWGDHDNDGDLDILLTGMETWWGLTSPDGNYTIMLSHLMIYENDGIGNFTSTNNNISSVEGSAKWFDHDNDGDLDVIVSGLNGIRNPDPNANSYYQYNWVNKIYTNDGSGNYSEITEGIDQGSAGHISFVDYDNDSDLDFLLTGNTLATFLYQYSDYYSKLYRNEVEVSNTIPNNPDNLKTTHTDSTITFSWDKATDNETPQDGLSYNLYVGTSNQSCDVVSPMSDLNSGMRKIVELGNACQDTTWTIKYIPESSYYWSVQAIDHCFSGSEFAPEQTFIILSKPMVQLSPNGTYINVSWSSIPGATSYNIYTSFDPEADFPVEWELAATGVTETIWTDTKTRNNKKFYKVIAVVDYK